MKKLILPLVLLSTSAFSQDFVKDLETLQEDIGQKEVDNYLKAPDKDGLPGPFLESLMPKPGLDTETVCEEENEPKKTHYEVIVVAQANSKVSELEILPGQRANLHTNTLDFLSRQVPYNENSKGLSTDAIQTRARDLWHSGRINVPSGGFDARSSLGRELLIESLVHASANSPLNEHDLSRSMASVISSVYKTDNEKYDALSALSLRLYRNYNNPRNPGFNNSKNNPFGAELPAGDITLNNLMTAASNFDPFQGGVCNDITEAVIQVGEHLFPDKDVLAINSGSHFGVLVTDGKNNRIIDGGDQMQMSNRLMLDPTLASTNLRISKMENGALKEIAVVDTELGQVMESAFQTGKTLLKTDADISTLMAHIKKENFGVSLGTGRLSDSQVVVVVAKYETSGDKWKGYAGVGASAQMFDGGAYDSKYQVHLRAGAERNIFRYVNSSTEVKFASGVRLSGMYSLNQPTNRSVVDTSGALDFYNRIDANYRKHNPDGVQIRSSLEVEQTLGPSNWGNTTGALSYMEPRDAGAVMRNMRFHLNQVNADLTAEKKLKPGVTGIVNTHYQGSNIGQSVSVLAGLDIKVPNGAQLLVFTGYTNADLPGYKTQHSLLGNPSGAQIGAKYTTKKGIEVGAQARSISGGKPQVNATIKVPLGGKR